MPPKPTPKNQLPKATTKQKAKKDTAKAKHAQAAKDSENAGEDAEGGTQAIEIEYANQKNTCHCVLAV